MRRWLDSGRYCRTAAATTSSTVSFFCIVAAFLITLLGGCSNVALLHPLPLAADPVEQAALAGEWQSEDTVVSLRFASNGIGCLAGLDWQDDHFRLEEGELIVSKGADKKYFTARFREKDTWPDQYYFVRYFLTVQGDLIIWPPSVGAFESAVASGQLEGTVEKGKWGTRVTITGSPEKIWAFLNDTGAGVLFEYEDPIVLRRIFPRPDAMR